MITTISSIIMIICLLLLRKKLSSVCIHHLTWAHQCRIACTCCCLSRARVIKHEVTVGSYTSTCCPEARCVVLLLAFDPHPLLHQRTHRFNAFQPRSFLSKNLIGGRRDRRTDGLSDRQTGRLIDRSVLLFTFNHFYMSSTITSAVSLGCPIMCELINHRPACKPRTSLSVWQARFWLIILYPLTRPGSERRPFLQFNLHIFSP